MQTNRGYVMSEESTTQNLEPGPRSELTIVESATQRSIPASVLLLVYLILFFCTGYLSFFGKDQTPGAERYVQALKIKDADDKAFVKDILQGEDAEHLKRKDLAMQAFNVVLGALLGFLSASATESRAPKIREEIEE